MTTVRSSDSVADLVRRLLSRKVSIEAMLEFWMWLSIPYLIAGIVFSFNAETVNRLETELRPRIPAGADLGAFGMTTALWPIMLIEPDVCES